MSSNIPFPTFTTAGLSLPSESAIKAGVWADFQAAFGGKLNQSDATPQGQLVSSLTAALGAANDHLAETVNLVDPALSSGRMQDAIGRIYFLQRIAATSTVATCTCTGAAGAVIPVGSLAQAIDGSLYASLAAATIGVGGSVSVQFAALNTGAIPCPAGTLTKIYRVVSGWDAITNPADGVTGREVESAAQFEARRAQSVALNAAGTIPAIRAAVLSVPGVVDAYVTENTSASSATIAGVSVVARSIFVSVFGGADADVAGAIWSRKAPGCNYTGTTTVTVTDTSPGYVTPYPSYAVKFTRAAATPLFIAVSLADNGLVPADATAQIKAALVAAFTGADGGPIARIGSTVYALRFVSAITALGSWAQVLSVTIGTSASPTAANVTLTAAQMPTLSASGVTVALV